MKEINENSPKIIAAKVDGCGWEILHIYVPNKQDKVYGVCHYYYDFCGEEISVDMIKKYVVLED